ncbi:MAG TPA: 5'-methylthioadenosine/adenosylhomocysteine nucleosidase [Lachnospiraceae bacterium]|jgi:adenosylhomocysteine nucleosidase|nr:5'-methylthioadenosine/adenosylhomocysteine nucleosidase [Lachnospiraceae bacterium]
MRIGVIGAMDVEVAALKEKLTKADAKTIAGMTFCEGELGRNTVIIVQSGVGKVNAGCCVQILCDLYHVDKILNTGVAGSLDAKINIGDFVVSTEAMYHDVDATVFGYAKGEVPQMHMVTFPADEELRKAAVAAIHESAPECQVFEGRIVSGDQFISSLEKKKELSDTFHGECAEMEGAAIAQAATINKVPYVIIRAISDKADGSDVCDYPKFEALAARHCAAIVSDMLESL